MAPVLHRAAIIRQKGRRREGRQRKEKEEQGSRRTEGKRRWRRDGKGGRAGKERRKGNKLLVHTAYLNKQCIDQHHLTKFSTLGAPIPTPSPNMAKFGMLEYTHAPYTLTCQISSRSIYCVAHEGRKPQILLHLFDILWWRHLAAQRKS